MSDSTIVARGFIGVIKRKNGSIAVVDGPVESSYLQEGDELHWTLNVGGKCELCEWRADEVKKAVRTMRAANERIGVLEYENQILATDLKVLWDELQLQIGKLSHSAEFSTAEANAVGINELKARVFERLQKHFGEKK